MRPILVLTGLIISLYLHAQTPQTYISFFGDTLSLYKYEGDKIMLLAKSDTFNTTIMKKWTDTMDGAYNFYKMCTGRDPKFMPRTYINQKLTIASVAETCGAGCGYLGWTGIELLDEYFELCYTSIRNENKHEQINFYELGRNFWFYGDKLSYENDPITTGFAVFMRFMSMKYLGVDGHPSHVDFVNKIRELRTSYLANSSLDWSNTLGIGQGVPDSPWGSADLFASFCFYLEETYGMQWVQNVWRYAEQRPNRTSNQDAVDNFVIAASQAANSNLVSLFQEWRWPVSQTAVDYIKSLRLGEPIFYLDENDVTIKCRNCVAGDTGTVNNILYEAVDRDLLIERRNADADLSKICTSPVTDLSEIFKDSNLFNQDISSWDVSNVTNMNRLFSGAASFNANISFWNVSKVISMQSMFENATSFNQPIGSWFVKDVLDMSRMFYGSVAFNQDLRDWCVSNITEEPELFATNSALNEDFKPLWGSCSFTFVPDDNFEQALIDLGYDSGPLDNYVLTSNIKNVTSIDISHRNINDLTGIGDFVSLESLHCRENHLLILDVSQIATLRVLDCAVNPLISLNLVNNTALEYLDCDANLLNSLDLSNNPRLSFLNCSGNQLPNLDISNNTELRELRCSFVGLNSLDLSKNNLLSYLNCEHNKLTTLDLRKNPSLAWLNCGFNLLSNLDISQNPLLEHFYCWNNRFKNLDISKNSRLTYFRCENNNLTFDSLEPAIGITNFTYSPQDSIGVTQYITELVGNTFIYPLEVGGENNIYQWYKDDVLLPSQTSDTLQLINVQLDDSGVYRCEVTNSIVSGLKLYSRKITIHVSISTNAEVKPGFDIFYIYPNPVIDKLNLKSSSSGVAKIFNLNGQLLYTQTINNLDTEIDLSRLIPSLYLLKFETIQGSETIQFIKK